MTSKDAVVGVVAGILRGRGVKLAQVGPLDPLEHLAAEIVDGLISPEAVGALKFWIANQPRRGITSDGWAPCEPPTVVLERMYATVTHQYYRHLPGPDLPPVLYRSALPNFLHYNTVGTEGSWEWQVKPTKPSRGV